jgi:hypothetical protein
MALSSNIQNGNRPVCRNCIHYRPPDYGGGFSSTIGTCNLFGEKHLITGEIEYETASSCRRDNKKCGETGQFFKEEPRLPLKIAKYYVSQPLTLFLLFFISFEILLLQAKTT